MRMTDSIFAFVKELNTFSYELSVLDRVWNILFPNHEGKWQHLHVTKYKQTYYITAVGGNSGGLEVEPKKVVGIENHDHLVTTWDPLISSARKWLKVVRKDWIKANKRVQVEYPFRYRYGIVPNALIRESLPDIYRLDKELGKVRTRKLVHLVENGFFLRAENTEAMSMTATDYFQYCKIAYMAGKPKEDTIDKSLSGREMYARYADGRHEGLLDINPSSLSTAHGLCSHPAVFICSLTDK